MEKTKITLWSMSHRHNLWCWLFEGVTSLAFEKRDHKMREQLLYKDPCCSLFNVGLLLLSSKKHLGGSTSVITKQKETGQSVMTQQTSPFCSRQCVCVHVCVHSAYFCTGSFIRSVSMKSRSRKSWTSSSFSGPPMFSIKMPVLGFLQAQEISNQ